MERRVRRRQVFYIPGYDPQGARRYRELYRAESARQAAISGYRIAMAGRAAGGWETVARIEGAVTRSRIDCLGWDDIVRDSLRRPLVGIYLLMIRTLWRFWASGALWPMVRLRPGPMIAGLAPVAFMLLYLLVALATGLLAGLAMARIPGVVGDWGAIPAGVAGFALVMAATRRLEGRLFAYYLVCDFAQVVARMGAWSPALSSRIDAFAARIGAALDSGVDEVLVVGHSSGAQIGVSALARALRDRPAGAAAIGFLTLGQAIPLGSFLPRADELRADLRDLSALAGQGRLFWLDVSAPGDGASFALCDPVAVSGVQPGPSEGPRPQAPAPLVISAAFSETLSPAWLRGLRWRYFRRHIQYLCAFDRPRDYDYFRITAGPATLAARFGGRAPSPNVERRAFSPYRSCA